VSLGDRLPLDDLVVAVIGDDPSANHARALLMQLGAITTGDPTSACTVIDTSGGSSRFSVPTARAVPCASVAAWAMSGAMSLTCGRNGRPATAGCGSATVLRGALLVVDVLSQLRTGNATRLPDAALLGERAAIATLTRHPGWSVGGMSRAIRARDGWWLLSMPRESDQDLVPALTQAHSERPGWTEVELWAAARLADDAVARAQLLGLAAARIPHPLQRSIGVPPTERIPLATVSSGGVRRPRAQKPLVVDLSSLWAGPLCASLLDMTGADIIKVESSRRLDGARAGAPAFYDLLHAGHRSVTVDLSDEAGRAQLRRLIMAADVVIESSRPRAMQQLGVDAGEVVRRGTIWTSITAYSRTGPWSNRVGFGDDTAAGAGLVAEIDGVPIPCGDAIADPLAGVHAAAATAAALLSDRAHLIDISMHDVATAAAHVTTETSHVHGSNFEGWRVTWDGGSCPVALPRVRTPTGKAAAPGADNDLLLGREISL
jgi:crotonobetainyl-CoA:carnitine CoA-transferase CaiB-like acyl-CoA transferase